MKTIPMSLETDADGKLKRMMSVTHQNPRCIYKEFPLNLFKFTCKYRTSRGRCRKRLLWGDKVQLCADGRCPGYGARIPKREE
jgi:hypothetical protein